ncbi:MAG: HD-GYP domain-containing protein [Clostridia bacterium]|nr:HD-GYP domain-containing protein [Clostridia bacterium]
MRLIPVSKQAIGRKLARTLYNEMGKPLLNQGTVLTERYVEALLARGIQGIYVEDPLFPNAEPEDVLTDKTRIEATMVARQVFQNVQENEQLPVQRIVATVQSIIDDVMQARSASSGLYLLRDYDHFAFTHSVNVCVYAVALGMQLGLDRQQLFDLGAGALLHDLGKIRFPEGFAESDAMSEEEQAIFRKHADDGFQLIRANPELSLVSAHVAYQHHERWDGQGFPRGLAGEAIHLYARITSVVNVFDNLCSRRPGTAEPLPDHVAAAHLLQQAGTALDTRLVRLFLKQLALYPVGTLVRLSNGFFGVVSRTVRGQPLRPYVRVLADHHNNLVDPFEISLVDNPHLSIRQIHTEYPPAIRDELERSSPPDGGQ